MNEDIKEYLLTTDEFRNPKVISGPLAMGVLITRLLLLIPGTNPRHPDMGVGITTYRFMLESEMYNLQSRIRDQMNTYLPSDYRGSTKVNLTINPNKYLVITIVVDGTSYIYDTEDTDNPVELSDLT